MRASSSLATRTGVFAALVLLSVVAFWTPLTLLARLALKEEHYSHILLIPLITAALLVAERRTIFTEVASHWPIGAGLLGAAAGLYGLAGWEAVVLSRTDRLSVTMLALVLAWIGGFIACYGLAASRRAQFPLLFLLLIVPFPDAVLDWSIVSLQKGSAEVSAVLFQLVNLPAYRDGFTFMLPGVTIEVARECSGIRSSLAMLVTSLLAGHLFLRTTWAKGLLSLATIPLLVIKNGIRIVTLSVLTIYVDPRFLTGSLHHQGGVVFFALAVALLMPLLWVLQRTERSAWALPPAAGHSKLNG